MQKLRKEKAKMDSKTVVYPKMRGLMAERGLTYDKMALSMGISISAFTAKINGKRDFTLQECNRITSKLNTTLDAIFFSK